MNNNEQDKWWNQLIRISPGKQLSFPADNCRKRQGISLSRDWPQNKDQYFGMHLISPKSMVWGKVIFVFYIWMHW